MKTKVDLKNKVKLKPIFVTDAKSDHCKVHYKGFSQTFAEGKTREEAEYWQECVSPNYIKNAQ